MREDFHFRTREIVIWSRGRKTIAQTIYAPLSGHIRRSPIWSRLPGHETCRALAELFPFPYSRKMIEGIDVSGGLLRFHLFQDREI